MPEEDAFSVLVQIMQQYRMRDMFKPSMAELGLCMYQLESIVQEQIPELNLHFQSQVRTYHGTDLCLDFTIHQKFPEFSAQSFQTSMYASSWFLTLYTTALNLTLSCRIMDVFLSEGMEFIFKVAIALLLIGKDTLLSLDMEAMLKVSCGRTPKNKADSSSHLQLLSTVLPKRAPPVGRTGQRRAVQSSIPGENQHQKDEENGKGVCRSAEKGTGRDGRAEGK